MTDLTRDEIYLLIVLINQEAAKEKYENIKEKLFHRIHILNSPK